MASPPHSASARRSVSRRAGHHGSHLRSSLSFASGRGGLGATGVARPATPLLPLLPTSARWPPSLLPGKDGLGAKGRRHGQPSPAGPTPLRPSHLPSPAAMGRRLGLRELQGAAPPSHDWPPLVGLPPHPALTRQPVNRRAQHHESRLRGSLSLHLPQAEAASGPPGWHGQPPPTGHPPFRSPPQARQLASRQAQRHWSRSGGSQHHPWVGRALAQEEARSALAGRPLPSHFLPIPMAHRPPARVFGSRGMRLAPSSSLANDRPPWSASPSSPSPFAGEWRDSPCGGEHWRRSTGGDEQPAMSKARKAEDESRRGKQGEGTAS